MSEQPSASTARQNEGLAQDAWRVPEGWLRRWKRRALSFAGFTLAWQIASLSLVLLPVTVIIDLVRRSRFALTRAQLAFWTFLSCEMGGMAVSLLVWLAKPFLSHRRWLEANSFLQAKWVRCLVTGLKALYGMRIDIENPEAFESSKPLLVFCRHASLIDSLLPAYLLAGKRHLRYVLKSELLWDPSLDVVGQRLPNTFVRRGSKDTEGELEKISALATGAGPDDAVVIFPEGTRFSKSRRERILASLAKNGHDELLEKARRLERVLLPRAAGAGAIVSACPEGEVVIISHKGLEGTQKLNNLLSGGLIGLELKIRLERFEAVPREPDVFQDWLWERWAGIDGWLAALESAGSQSS